MPPTLNSWNLSNIHPWKLTWHWKSPCSIGNTSSNSVFSIVMLVFGGMVPTQPTNHTPNIPCKLGWGFFPNPTYQQFPGPWLSVVPLVLVDVLLLEEFLSNLIGSSKEGAWTENLPKMKVQEVQVEGSLQQVSNKHIPAPNNHHARIDYYSVIFEEFERDL